MIVPNVIEVVDLMLFSSRMLMIQNTSVRNLYRLFRLSVPLLPRITNIQPVRKLMTLCVRSVKMVRTLFHLQIIQFVLQKIV